jgi:hypothetical protein
MSSGSFSENMDYLLKLIRRLNDWVNPLNGGCSHSGSLNGNPQYVFGTYNRVNCSLTRIRMAYIFFS